MAAPSLNSTVIARMAQAAYGFKLGNASMTEAIQASSVANGGPVGLMNQLYARDFASLATADVASKVVQNVGITSADPIYSVAVGIVQTALDGADPANRGGVLIDLVNNFTTLTNDPNVRTVVAQFNTDIARAVTYSQTFGTTDVDLHGGIFSLDSSNANVMRLTGNEAVRIDITRHTDQVTGLDLNRNGVIEFNGKENVNPTTLDDGKNFTIVDAYTRNPNNVTDITKNYVAPINFDGTGFAGDGVKTNGNIFLGGLNADVALGGIGNDFLAGGGSRAFNDLQDGTSSGTQTGGDRLIGGRNADFFFAELSLLSPTDGNNNSFDGGITADDIVAGVGGTRGLGTQDNDWILPEASDDDEPATVNLTTGTLATRAGAVAALAAIESVNASGNLFGFLNGFNTVVGARAYDGNNDAHTVGQENYGRGSTAQLNITGNADNNALIGGYDNDNIDGAAGNDLLMGGDLRFLITNKNNPNLLDANGGLNLTASAQGLVFDGKDNLTGGAGNDNIVFEADNGTVDGGADTGKTSGQAPLISVTDSQPTDDQPYSGPRYQSQGDTLWLTDFSMGRLAGATLAGEATAQANALAKLSPDSTFRVDLGGGANFRNYGGAAQTGIATVNSQDVTNYAGTTSRVTLTGMDSVNTTGLGAIDYKAAGSNSPDLAFNNQQNYAGLQASVDLRGNDADNALLANNGTDTIEGRGGDDVVSGGAGNDRFVMALGDDIDWAARPVDANGDGLWDTTGGLVVASGVAWGQDFRPPAAATAGTRTLVVDFGATVLDGVDTFVATFRVKIDGVNFGDGIDPFTLGKAKSVAEVASIVNASYHAQDPSVTVVATSPSTIQVIAVDKTPGDGILPEIGTTLATGYLVVGQAAKAGQTFNAFGSILGQSGTNLEDDRLVVKTYEQRPVNLGLDQTKNEITQAAQFVTNFSSAGSQIVEGQSAKLYIDNVREGDKLSVDINGAKYEYTLKAGENAEAGAAGLAAAVNAFLDINSASGRVAAVADPFSGGDRFDDTDTATIGQQNNTDRALVTLSQTIVAGSQTYMNVAATVTRADGATPFGSVALHNQSNTEFQMLGFDARDGALYAQGTPSASASTDVSGTKVMPVVLFQGRNTGDSTMSLLVTAKNTGGALNGLNANLDADDANGGYINGDDLLIGGDGNDIISGGTGDDRILMSKGTDTADGGGNITRVDKSTQVFQDVLQAEEATFGTGTSFKVTLDGSLTTGLGKGTVAAIKSDGSPTGDVTTFTTMELVRVLENNRNSELDVKALSDSVAAAAASGPAGGVIVGTEGLNIAVTATPSTKYTVDFNNDGVAAGATEVNVAATAVLGVESVTTGNANDTITVDQTQANANNRFTMGAQQGNETSKAEGADTVVYDHIDINNDGVVNNNAAAVVSPAGVGGFYTVVLGDVLNLAGTAVGTVVKELTSFGSDLNGRPDLTVAVAALSSGTVAATKGVLASSIFTDTLNGVEVVDVTNAATSGRLADKLDVSALGGATINYGAAEKVGKTLGGVDVAPVSVAETEADTLESGGVSLTGKGLGNELMEIVGITTLENVVGSAGSDRVILDDTMNAVVAIPAPAAGSENVGKNSTWMTSAAQAAMGLPAVATAISVQDYGLYNFDLAAGDDSLDYKQETGIVTVVVDTSGTTDKDLVFVGAGAGGTERVDTATGVERYFGGTGGNFIDVVGSGVDTTIQFSKEARSNSPANDKAEPQGNDGTVVAGETRAAEVRATGTTATLALFMDRTGVSDIGIAATSWLNVVGSNTKAETVMLTDNEVGAAHALFLAGGKNVVDYGAMTNNVTAIIGSVARGVDAFQVQVTGTTGTGGDAILQELNLDNDNNFLSIVGTGVSGDTVNIAALVPVVVAPGTVGTPANRGTLSSVNTGALQRHVVNLNSGEVREDIHGQYGDVNAVLRGANLKTVVSAFENVSNGADADAVTLIGNGGVNGLTGGTGADVILGGRGTAPIGATATGDALEGQAGADWFVYTDETESPGGSVTLGQQSATVFGAAPAGDAAVVRSQDTFTAADFLTGTDKLVFVVGSDTWEVVKVTTAIPANLAAVVGSVAAAVTPGAVGVANSATVTMQVDIAAASVPAREQNYFINTPGSTPVDGDLIFRVAMTSGADVVDAGLGQSTKNLNAAADDGLAVHFVYTDKNQSQGGGFDQVLNFTTGQDKIDLSFLRAPEWEARFGTDYDVGNNNVADAIEGIRVIPGLPVAINADLPNLFKEAGGQMRAVAIQTTTDGNLDPSTVVFIDVNHDGNYTVGSDMVLSLVGVGAPALGDFIFDRYDQLGLNNEVPGFAANADPGT